MVTRSHLCTQMVVLTTTTLFLVLLFRSGNSRSADAVSTSFRLLTLETYQLDANEDKMQELYTLLEPAITKKSLQQT